MTDLRRFMQLGRAREGIVSGRGAGEVLAAAGRCNRQEPQHRIESRGSAAMTNATIESGNRASPADEQPVDDRPAPAKRMATVLLHSSREIPGTGPSREMILNLLPRRRCRRADEGLAQYPGRRLPSSGHAGRPLCGVRPLPEGRRT